MLNEERNTDASRCSRRRAQANEKFRKQIQGLNQLRVKSERGQMVPLASLVRVVEEHGPGMIVRYNLYPAVAINGTPVYSNTFLRNAVARQ